jgi:preprotein translocase subunit SecA
MRIFGSDRISGLMQKLGMEEGVPIEHGMVSRAIERAQKQVETQNFSIRKHLLEYDDMMNRQRESVYTLRREILEGRVHLTEDEIVDTREYMLALGEEILAGQVERFAGGDVPEEDRDVPALLRDVSRVFGLDPRQLEALELDDRDADDIVEAIWGLAKKGYEEKEQLVGADLLRRVERDVMLQIVDVQWKDHLYSLDHLKEGIGLRGYGQRDPLIEYKKESFALFQDMKARIEEEIVRYLFWLRPVLSDQGPEAGPGQGGRPVGPLPRPSARRPSQMTMNNPAAEAVPAFAGARQAAPAAGGADPAAGAADPRAGGSGVVRTVRREEPKVGRNDPCPCGSGKKYKKCHGAAA